MASTATDAELALLAEAAGWEERGEQAPHPYSTQYRAARKTRWSNFEPRDEDFTHHKKIIEGARQGKVRRIHRDAAALRPTNIESTKYKGLVCGDARSMYDAEEALDAALRESRDEIHLRGDIVRLPDNIGELFPDLHEFTCGSLALSGIPASLQTVKGSVRCSFSEFNREIKDLQETSLNNPVMIKVMALDEARGSDILKLQDMVLKLQDVVLDLQSVVLGLQDRVTVQEATIRGLELGKSNIGILATKGGPSVGPGCLPKPNADVNI